MPPKTTPTVELDVPTPSCIEAPLYRVSLSGVPIAMGRAALLLLSQPALPFALELDFKFKKILDSKKLHASRRSRTSSLESRSVPPLKTRF